MSRRAGDRLLNWGFVAALTLHGVALAGAACLPAQVMKDELSDIRVFDAQAPALVVPVELVELPSAAEPEPQPAPVTVAVVRQEPRPEPAVQKPSPPGLPKPPPTQPVVRPKPPAPEPKPVVAQPSPPSTSPSVPPEAVVKAGGGGGGDSVSLGTPSPNGDLMAEGGQTPVGVVPGSGSGSGSGVGPGEGRGSGGGSGGGAGTGAGSGPGAGTGAGHGGADSGFSSRIADRREPVVVLKGNLEYPSSAVADGVEGVVKLRVLVSERGTVGKVTVVESSRDRRLDSAAVEFVRGWRYKPAVQDGQPRSVYTYAVVQFELK